MKKSANFLFRLNTKLKQLINTSHSFTINGDLKNIPVIINNYNRLEYLLKLITWLEDAGMTNIHIIDNNSTYQPLLKFYNNTTYSIYRLDCNKGHFALWETVLFSRFSKEFYVYTDPDVVPVDECPHNVVLFFNKLLLQYPKYGKVGFGLKIDDIPDEYPLKENVIKWEKQFWETELETDVYDALIDTTFALYRPGARGGADIKAIRTGGKYIARHLPWYENPENLSEESAYYLNKASAASSWYQALKGEKNPY